MAIQNGSLNSAEHDWFATRSGIAGNAPTSAHKKAYFSSKGIAESKPLSQAEREWLQKVGSTTSIDPFELWVRACQAQTVTPGKSINDCKMRFFTSIASGTNP